MLNMLNWRARFNCTDKSLYYRPLCYFQTANSVFKYLQGRNRQAHFSAGTEPE